MLCERLGIDQTKGDFQYDMTYEFDAGTGLNEKTVDYISSVGLRVLMIAAKQMRERQAPFMVAALQSQLSGAGQGIAATAPPQ